MNNTCLVTCDDEITPSVEGFSFFSLQSIELFQFNVDDLQHDEELNRLVFLIARKPKCLINHMRRIYFCFQKKLDNQLFAAIVDFLVVLNKRGQEISWRVLLGAKSCLTTEQFEQIKTYLKNEEADISLLLGNQYSVFSKGLIGVSNIIRQVDALEKKAGDPLEIASDHIQYCQLDEAQDVLEEAILVYPDREDLRQELFDLYKSTNNKKRFYQMLAKLVRSDITVTDDWHQLNNYFKGRNNNG